MLTRRKFRNFNLIQVLMMAGMLALVGLLASCGGTDAGEEALSAENENGKVEEEEPKDGDEEEEKKEEAVPVEVSTLGRGSIESVLRSSTSLEAESHVQVFSQAARLVRELLVEEGDRVQEGQVLLRLQDEEQRSELGKVTSQLDKAIREYERQERLFEQKLISEQVFNEATYELEQLEIALSDAKRTLGYTEVRAPISGTITARMVMLGDQVNIGQHLFDIVDFDSMVARIYVPERNLMELRTGLPSRISAQALGGREFRGTVKRIAPVVDPKSGTVKVTVAVGRQPGLRPGMYVDVALVTATHPKALLLPKRALIYDNDQVFIYRLGEERRVERVNVVPVLANKEFVEPKDDLFESDQVVIAGQAGLKDGALVSLPGDKDPDEEEESELAVATAEAQESGESL